MKHSKKILVVDDNLVILKTVGAKLSAKGYSVVTVQDGAAAIAVARREKPDLILLDIGFPPDVAHGGGVPWDGFLIMHWLRRVDEAKNIPVIIMTGSDAAHYEELAQAAGAADFFRKPLDHEGLLSAIEGTLEEAGGASPLCVTTAAGTSS